MTPSPKLLRVARRLLLGLASILTAVALFVTVENWRGDRAWATARADLSARGEPILLAELAPAQIANEVNFLQTPRLVRVLFAPADGGEASTPAEIELLNFRDTGRVLAGQMTVAALHDVLTKRGLITGPSSPSPASEVLGVLGVLTPFTPLFHDLRLAAEERPLAALTRAGPIGTVRLIDASRIFSIAQFQALRARLLLDLQRPTEARADVFALQRLGSALASRPDTIMHFLVGLAIHETAAGVINEGCRRHAWADADLAKFNRELESLNPLAGLNHALLSERANLLSWIDAPVGQPTPPPWLFHGWRQHNKLELCARFDREIFAAISLTTRRVFPDRLCTAFSIKPSALAAFLHPFRWLSSFVMPNLEGIILNVARNADELTLSQTSWALERHRLAHGAYPATLDDLSPSFLSGDPRGVFDGHRLGYEQLPNGDRRLSSCGPNSRDEHGEGDDVVLLMPGGT